MRCAERSYFDPPEKDDVETLGIFFTFESNGGIFRTQMGPTCPHIMGRCSMSVAAEQDNLDSQSVKTEGLGLVAWPTSQNENPVGELGQVGRYNAHHLAGQALSLAESLSPSYMQVYVNSLEDFSALKELNHKKKR